MPNDEHAQREAVARIVHAVLIFGDDVCLVFVFASQGLLMAPLSIALLASLLLATALYAIGLDTLKIQVFRRFVRQGPSVV